MQKNSLVAAALFVTAGLSPVAAAPAVAAPTAPITVKSCSPIMSSIGSSIDALPSLIQTGVQITFVNTAPFVAKDVEFQIGAGDDSERVIDYGTFAPGALIRHVFLTEEDSSATCRLAAVHFTNGTAYNYGEILSASR